MKLPSSLFTKILAWFFLNLVLVMVVLGVFFSFQAQIDLPGLFGREATQRLRTAGMLIAHDLRQAQRDAWPEVLARHAAVHRVDFLILFADGSHVASRPVEVPDKVGKKIRETLMQQPFRGKRPDNMAGNGLPMGRMMGKKPQVHHDRFGERPRFLLRSENPTLYWSGVRIRRPFGGMRRPVPIVFLAVSDSLTGNGFFFDPFPWLAAAVIVFSVSALFWIPMVRHITRPLGRMTRVTEEIARGRFEVVLHEPRTDEIGRLAVAIRHMSRRLAAIVKGQKRFLGDVAHELGSPIARIQFGLGALEQRMENRNRQRLADVMEDVAQLSRLVNELLAFSRADINAHTVRLQRIELLPVVRAAVRRESKAGAPIDCTVDPNIRVVASRELLIRALSNLVRNALAYAAESGPIEIVARERKRWVQIEVRDRGPGVSTDRLDQLFEPFFRPETSRDRESGGVGLGLAIVKTCVEACKGTVAAKNLSPRGFAVTMRLPSENR